VQYYAEVAAAVALPIVIQDEPVTTGVQMPAALLARIAAAAPSCRYAKVEHLPTPPKFSEIAALAPDAQLGLFGGSGGLYFLEELQRGARGIMTGFAFPEALVEVWARFTSGDESGAAEAFYRWLPLLKLEGQPVLGLAIRKEILRRRGALPNAVLRRPGPTLDAGTACELDALIERTAGAQPVTARS
jgi:4-hydroxy-tetrahydrodipicolinate synthase